MTLPAGADLAGLDALASQERLTVFGAFSARPEDGIGEGTLALLGPAEPGFWAHFTASAEFSDGAPDPLDRWSTRVIGALAEAVRGTALFPFGAPSRPFIAWALRSVRAWQSPVVMLVHDTAGLMVSYRGAILLPGALPDSPAKTIPCETCADRPCLTACPTRALTEGSYDIDACHAFLDRPDGATCMSGGCLVRRACPLSQSYGRSERQSAFHMERFHPCR